MERKSSFGMMFGGVMNPSHRNTQDYSEIICIKMLKLKIYEAKILIGGNGSLIRDELGLIGNKIKLMHYRLIWMVFVCLNRDKEDG